MGAGLQQEPGADQARGASLCLAVPAGVFSFTLKKALAEKGIGNPVRTAGKTALWPHHEGSPECARGLRREQMDGRGSLGVLTACLHLSSWEVVRDPRGTCSIQTQHSGGGKFGAQTFCR